MRPQADEYPDVLEAALTALIQQGPEAGATALAPIAYPRREVVKKRAVGIPVAARVMKRDGFHCRYCGGKTVLGPIMELLGSLYPDVFPFHPNWKGGQTHPAVISRSPEIDHVEPVSLGGLNSEDNLVTACAPCNTIKSDFTLEVLGWEVKPIEPSGWDGLTRFYADLWRLTGEPKPAYHLTWMKALGLQR